MTLNEIEDGIIAAITAAGLGLTTVRALSTRDIEKTTGDLMVIPPAALVAFGGSELEVRDVPGRTYQWHTQWEVIVVTEDLSGDEAASAAAYAMLDGLKQALAAIDIAGTGGKAHLFLEGEEWQKVESGQAVYALSLRADSFFQKV